MARAVVFPCSRFIGVMFACALILTLSAAVGADLTVKVTEAGTDTPMAGAVVTVTTLGTEKAVSQEETSDSAGTCRLSIDANGELLRLDVKRSGWCPLRLEIPAQSPALAGPLSFPMKRAGTFGGSIRDEFGKPVAGAHVSANFPQRLTGAHIPLDDLNATSDAQGKWESDFVPAATELLRITVTHPDYAWDGNQPSREELAAKSAVCRMQSVLALSGRVVGPDGQTTALSRTFKATEKDAAFDFELKGAPTRAEPVRAAMQASADSVTPGGQFEVLVQARVFSDFHIYGLDPKVSPFSPTSLKLTLPDGLEAVGDWTGPSPARDKAGVEIYTGAAVFRRALKARAGAAPKKCSIGVELEYQVCNDDMCYPARKVELAATVEIAAARQP